MTTARPLPPHASTDTVAGVVLPEIFPDAGRPRRSDPPGEADDRYGRLARRDPSDLIIHRRGRQTASPRRPIWDNDHIVSSSLLRPTIAADVTLCADGSARVIPFVLPLNVTEESMSMTVRDWLRLDEKTMMVGMLDQSAIIARIRALRLARGLTIQYLADQTGIHRSIIGKLERGKRKTFNLDEARALCDALKVDLRVVISDEPMSIIE